MPYHEMLTAPLCKLAGALPHEVVAMNQLYGKPAFIDGEFLQAYKATLQNYMRSKAFPPISMPWKAPGKISWI